MGITLSFIFCLLSGFACFWLFWKCVDWFENIERKRRIDYVHSIIRIRYCDLRLFDVRARQTRKVLK